jgi:hypothetical protein
MEQHDETRDLALFVIVLLGLLLIVQWLAPGQGQGFPPLG